MKLPNYRPMPREWNNDHDTKDISASLAVVLPVLLFVAGVGLLLIALFR